MGQDHSEQILVVDFFSSLLEYETRRACLQLRTYVHNVRADQMPIDRLRNTYFGWAHLAWTQTFGKVWKKVLLIFMLAINCRIFHRSTEWSKQGFHVFSSTWGDRGARYWFFRLFNFLSFSGRLLLLTTHFSDMGTGRKRNKEAGPDREGDHFQLSKSLPFHSTMECVYACSMHGL